MGVGGKRACGEKVRLEGVRKRKLEETVKRDRLGVKETGSEKKWERERERDLSECVE